MSRPDETVRPDLGPGFRPIEMIGAGGMGTVWTAHHAGLDRTVAVKVMSDGAGESVRARARFMREAKTASLVKGPHVVEVLEVSTSAAGIPFIVMELLHGRDFSDYLEEHGRLPVEDVASVVSQLARALSSAHALGVVHRDVKPSNIFVCDGHGGLFVKLLDFGIAKDVSTIRGETTTGVIGTPHYMSPEQLIAGETDFRSDLWSLGVVAFRALTGVRPFERETLGALALAIHTAPLPCPSAFNAALPAEVDTWFFRACARDPKQRFDSAEDAAAALEVAVRTTPRPRPSLAPALLGGFVRPGAVDRTLTVDDGFPEGAGAPSSTAKPRRSSRLLVAFAAAALTCVAVAGGYTRAHTGWSRKEATEATLAAREDRAPRQGQASPPPSDIRGTGEALAETLAHPSQAQDLEMAREARDEAGTPPIVSVRPPPRARRAAPANPSAPPSPPAGAQKSVHASARIVDDLPDDRH